MREFAARHLHSVLLVDLDLDVAHVLTRLRFVNGWVIQALHFGVAVTAIGARLLLFGGNLFANELVIG